MFSFAVTCSKLLELSPVLLLPPSALLVCKVTPLPTRIRPISVSLPLPLLPQLLALLPQVEEQTPPSSPPPTLTPLPLSQPLTPPPQIYELTPTLPLSIATTPPKLSEATEAKLNNYAQPEEIQSTSQGDASATIRPEQAQIPGNHHNTRDNDIWDKTVHNNTNNTDCSSTPSDADNTDHKNGCNHTCMFDPGGVDSFKSNIAYDPGVKNTNMKDGASRNDDSSSESSDTDNTDHNSGRNHNHMFDPGGVNICKSNCVYDPGGNIFNKDCSTCDNDNNTSNSSHSSTVIHHCLDYNHNLWWTAMLLDTVCNHPEEWGPIFPLRPFDLAPCFEEAVLSSVPLGSLILLSLLRSWHLSRLSALQRTHKINTWLLWAKLVVLGLILLTGIVNLGIAISLPRYVSFYPSFILEAIAFLVLPLLTYLNHTPPALLSFFFFFFFFE